MSSSDNLLVKPRRAYNRIIDNEKRKRVAAKNKRWRLKNPDKQRLSNLLFRQKNPNYNDEYQFKKHVEKYGNIPIPIKKSNMSKFEQTWSEIIRLEFPYLEFVKIRPDWLKNPKTGYNLELDMYCENYRLAIEISGDQHFYYTPIFHKDIDAFIDQVERDIFKVRRCREMGIKLIVITKRDKPSKILSKIYDHLDIQL